MYGADNHSKRSSVMSSNDSLNSNESYGRAHLMARSFCFTLMRLFCGADWRKINHKCKRRCRKIVKSQAFYWVVMVLVFFNTVICASEHNDQPAWLEDLQSIGEAILLVSFIAAESFSKSKNGIIWRVSRRARYARSCGTSVILVLGVIITKKKNLFIFLFPFF